jgi:glycosyltransferase involved in cell wall biosynthesis
VPAHTGSNRRKRIISVGRLSPEKGQAGLIEAFASVASEFKDAELVFVGDGPAAQDLRVRAAGTAVADRISFLGRLGEEETLEQIAGSEILVLSSFMEGLPIVLLEAMAVGTAVIATRVAGIPELVEDAKSGLLFTPSKWDELAACLRRLLQDKTFRGELAENGRQAIATEFNIKRSAQDLRTLFEGKAS